MILGPPQPTMDKSPNGTSSSALHRGDTVRTLGPPSYNSSVANGLQASSSSSSSGYLYDSKTLPATPEHPEDSQSSSYSLSPPRPAEQRGVLDGSLPTQTVPSAPVASQPPSPLSRASSSSTTPQSASPLAQDSFPSSTPPRHPSTQTYSTVASLRSTVRSQVSLPASSYGFERTYSEPDFIREVHSLTDAPVVNGIHLVQDDSISGSWRLDPDLPAVNKAPKKCKRPRRARKAMQAEPNISLETKSGAIAAQLAIVGRANYDMRKAFVRVTTRTGKVNIDVKEQTVGRFFDLDVYSKNGQSIILIPRSFKGIIELYSLKGKLIVRPALGASARTLKSSSEELLLLVGGASTDSGSLTDYVRFNSEGGASVVIGYTNEDDITMPAHGFWKKFGLMLQGKSTRVVEKTTMPAHI